MFRSNLPCTVFHGNALQRLQCAATVLLELDTHTVAMQEQCVPTKQAQLTVGWVGEPDKPNPANPQKLIGSVSPLGRSARSAKSTVASSGQHFFNLRILQLLELVNFGWNQGCSVALEAMHILFAGLES